MPVPPPPKLHVSIERSVPAEHHFLWNYFPAVLHAPMELDRGGPSIDIPPPVASLPYKPRRSAAPRLDHRLANKAVQRPQDKDAARKKPKHSTGADLPRYHDESLPMASTVAPRISQPSDFSHSHVDGSAAALRHADEAIPANPQEHHSFTVTEPFSGLPSIGPSCALGSNVLSRAPFESTSDDIVVLHDVGSQSLSSEDRSAGIDQARLTGLPGCDIKYHRDERPTQPSLRPSHGISTNPGGELGARRNGSSPTDEDPYIPVDHLAYAHDASSRDPGTLSFLPYPIVPHIQAVPPACPSRPQLRLADRVQRTRPHHTSGPMGTRPRSRHPPSSGVTDSPSPPGAPAGLGPFRSSEVALYPSWVDAADHNTSLHDITADVRPEGPTYSDSDSHVPRELGVVMPGTSVGTLQSADIKAVPEPPTYLSRDSTQSRADDNDWVGMPRVDISTAYSTYSEIAHYDNSTLPQSSRHPSAPQHVHNEPSSQSGPALRPEHASRATRQYEQASAPPSISPNDLLVDSARFRTARRDRTNRRPIARTSPSVEDDSPASHHGRMGEHRGKVPPQGVHTDRAFVDLEPPTQQSPASRATSARVYDDYHTAATTSNQSATCAGAADYAPRPSPPPRVYAHDHAAALQVSGKTPDHGIQEGYGDALQNGDGSDEYIHWIETSGVTFTALVCADAARRAQLLLDEPNNIPFQMPTGLNSQLLVCEAPSRSASAPAYSPSPASTYGHRVYASVDDHRQLSFPDTATGFARDHTFSAADPLGADSFSTYYSGDMSAHAPSQGLVSSQAFRRVAVQPRTASVIVDQLSPRNSDHEGAPLVLEATVYDTSGFSPISSQTDKTLFVNSPWEAGSDASPARSLDHISEPACSHERSAGMPPYDAGFKGPAASLPDVGYYEDSMKWSRQCSKLVYDPPNVPIASIYPYFPY